MASGACTGGACRGMGTTGHEISHRPADAVVQAGGDEGKLVAVYGDEVEQATLCPVTHDVMAAEQRNLVRVGHLAQDALVLVEGFCPHLKTTNDSSRVHETYIKIKKPWYYLYRAVDSEGSTLDFLLSATRDAKAAERFFRKALRASHTVPPRVITVDNNAAYPPAFEALQQAGPLPKGCRLRQQKYLNNPVEQNHRLMKRRVNPGLGFEAFHTAQRTIQDYEAMRMIRKGQLQGGPKLDVLAQNRAIAQMFGLLASRGSTKPLTHSNLFLQHYLA